MYCNRCGNEAPDAASFCSACGIDLHATTPMIAVDVFERESDLDVVRGALKADYDVKEEIGRGGMATVYRAEETGLGRQVAIKVLPFSHTHDSSLVERFQLEARTSAKLEHPNIIPIYRVGRQGDVIYFTMRYLQGPSLSELIGEMGAMTPDQIRRILVESARGLGHAHNSGVVHRDIKPDNIMFKDNGEAVVCDFGIAKAASGTGLTGTGMAIGTPYYMSPEQVRAKPLSGSSDIYSLGVVAYQCMTTRVPFDGDDSFAIGYKHVMDDPPVPDIKTADQQALWDVIRRMMEKHPSDRFQDARELIAALDGEVESIPITVKQPAVRPTPGSPATKVQSALIAGRPASRRASVMTPTTPVPRISIEAPRPKRKRSPLRIAAMLGGVFFMAGGSGSYFYLENGGRIPDGLRQFEPIVRVRAPWLAELVPLDRWLANGLPAPADSSAQTARDSTLTLPIVLGDSSSLQTDSVVKLDSTTVADSVVLAGDSDSGGAEVDTLPAPPLPPTTGTLVVRNLGARASLWIDGRRVSGIQHELPAGDHGIRVAAPEREPYAAIVTVIAGNVVRHRVNLRERSQCDQVGPSYNRNGECFDRRAGLDPRTITLVPLDGTVPRRPTTPAELAVRVMADGSIDRIIVRSPSDVPEFAVLAVAAARNFTYLPATKDGQPIAAWTTVALYAKP